MPTFTSRLKLIKRSDLENVSVEDLNANFDDIDEATGAQFVTSATRPLVPYDGQIIYETDTKKVYFWDSTKWVYVHGEPGRYFEGNPTGVTTSAEVLVPLAVGNPFFPCTELEVGARYKLEHTWAQQPSAANDRMGYRVRYTEAAAGNPANPTTASPLLTSYTWGAPGVVAVGFTQSLVKVFQATQPNMTFAFSHLVAGGAGTSAIPANANGFVWQATVTRV